MKQGIYKLSNGKFISEPVYTRIKSMLDILATGDIANIAPNVCGIALIELQKKATDNDYVIREQRAIDILKRLGLVNKEGEIDLDVQNIASCAIQYSPQETYAMLINPLRQIGDHSLLDQEANGV